MALFQLIPWTFYTVGSTRFWVHYGLVILGFVLAVITAIAQQVKPAPYGKHADEQAKWGPKIPQRLGHIFSDALPGVVLFCLVFFLYGGQLQPVNCIFLALFLQHYIQRGIIHPLTMRYRDSKVPLGITLGGFVPNCLYHFLMADMAGSAVYASNYYDDPRFILGVILYEVGYIINRWADWKLRSLRSQGEAEAQLENATGSIGYYIPYGGLFELVSCPNYLGEFIEWIGWALATWCLAGFVWLLFCAATFFPRSKHNHLWYKQQFELYPLNRRALIPFVY